jgi:hypothetical protein
MKISNIALAQTKDYAREKGEARMEANANVRTGSIQPPGQILTFG